MLSINDLACTCSAVPPITMGMQTTVHDIPQYLITLVEALRAKLRDPDFLARHRVRPQDFTRQRQLTFPLLMLFLLQQTVKSIQRHLHEFLDELAQGQLFEPVTSGAVTHARAKLKESAFSELNRDCVLSALYHSEHPVRRWRGHRLVGFDSSLVRLPDSDELGQAFGWQAVSNQNGATGTRYPEARLSVVYDVLNRAGWDRRILLLAVRPVPFWWPKSCLGSTAPTKAKSSGSSPRRTRKQSASAWGCRCRCSC